jgi:hypothetical protein
MTVSFIRLVHITVYDPPYVPLGPAALRDRKGYREKGKGKIGSDENGIGTGEYDPRNNSGGTSPDIPGSNNDPDSPGLELFYTKNIFVCEMDGRPIWCSQCSNWCALSDLCLADFREVVQNFAEQNADFEAGNQIVLITIAALDVAYERWTTSALGLPPSTLMLCMYELTQSV